MSFSVSVFCFGHLFREWLFSTHEHTNDQPVVADHDSLHSVSQTEVQRFLGACAFYHIWIPHYAHVSEPLYALLKKRKKFEWEDEHTYTVQKLKKLLLEAQALLEARELHYI